MALSGFQMEFKDLFYYFQNECIILKTNYRNIELNVSFGGNYQAALIHIFWYIRGKNSLDRKYFNF